MTNTLLRLTPYSDNHVQVLLVNMDRVIWIEQCRSDYTRLYYSGATEDNPAGQYIEVRETAGQILDLMSKRP